MPSKNFLDFYDKKDLNWFNKPSGSYVNDFMKMEFDILIDLSLVDIFQTKYISTLSNQNSKLVKVVNLIKKYLILMIDINSKTSLDEFITLIIHYLSIINKKVNE